MGEAEDARSPSCPAKFPEDVAEEAARAREPESRIKFTRNEKHVAKANERVTKENLDFIG